MSEWQLIDAAPKDGTDVDLWVVDFSIGEGGKLIRGQGKRITDARWAAPYDVHSKKHRAECWHHRQSFMDEEIESYGCRATHWMLPPGAPE